jgi:DNA polymerase elongation subunit (family B)
MTENFYTNVIQKGDTLLVRAIENGKRIQRKVSYKPTLYTRTKDTTEYKTLEGHSLKPIKLSSMRAAREFLKNYEQQPGTIFGMERYHYCYLAENYPGLVEWERDKVLILTIDIEVASENGFPDPNTAVEEVLAITVKNHKTKKIMVWGINDYNNTRDDVVYVYCNDEKVLLEKFVEFMANVKPDVITGWNTTFFDIPYLCNRITNLFGSEMMYNLSPWEIVTEEKTVTFGRDVSRYNIWGVSSLDYLDLYKKFTYTDQESFALDYISFIELGVKKDPNPYDTFKEWYTKDYQSFVDYNIKDVELVDALEDHLGMIQLMLTMAYEAKINYNDVYSQNRMWDVIIYNYLRDKNIVIPQRRKSHKVAKYEGAYVKEPQTGQHDWIMSFDLNSLYPHLIMQYNISLETLIKEQFPKPISVKKLLAKDVDTDILKGKNLTVTPNGACFRTDVRGFLPELMEKFYIDRVKFKGYLLEAKQRYEDTKDKKYLKQIATYHNIQMARKIALNSAYGALGNEYFRYYDERMATAITTSGQLAIRWIENKVNEYLNKLLKSDNIDYVVASDTDSIYVRFKELVDKVNPKNPVEFLDKVAIEKLEPYIHKCYAELAQYLYVYEDKMDMAREVIADKGIWTAKKRYILNVHDSEGVRYAEPELKVMGLESVKSSTPHACREKIKDSLKVIVAEDERSVNKFIRDFRKEFMALPVESMAFPRSVNGIKKWGDRSSVFKKGTPMHIKGALIYNYLLNKNKLTHKYPLIMDGEKLKFILLRTPNALQSNVIAFLSELPKEFGLHEQIDYDKQFEKSFVDPISLIMECIDWNVDRSYGTRRTLEEFFG